MSINIGNNNKIKNSNIVEGTNTIHKSNPDSLGKHSKFIVKNILIPILVTIVGGIILFFIQKQF